MRRRTIESRDVSCSRAAAGKGTEARGSQMSTTTTRARTDDVCPGTVALMAHQPATTSSAAQCFTWRMSSTPGRPPPPRGQPVHSVVALRRVEEFGDEAAYERRSSAPGHPPPRRESPRPRAAQESSPARPSLRGECRSSAHMDWRRGGDRGIGEQIVLVASGRSCGLGQLSSSMKFDFFLPT